MTELKPGDRFDTAAESGCIAVTAPEPDGFTAGNFDGLDSDGVLCSFSLVMVTAIYKEASV